MADSLLTIKKKEQIIKAIRQGNFKKMIYILETVKTPHAGTPKTKDKRFTVRDIINFVKEKNQDNPSGAERDFFKIGTKLCGMKEIVASQLGILLIWRAYNNNKAKVKKLLLKIADHPNWEVRESAGGAFASTLFYNDDFYSTLKKWAKHKSPNVRRAVVFGALGLRERKNTSDVKRAFKLLEPLLYDSAVYVKKNLGPFILGSYYGRSHPKELFAQLAKWVKIKDPHLRWNVAMTFNNSFGYRYPKEALKYLKILSQDENIIVKRAVNSTINHLRKRYKDIGIK
jgi:hypothetical protein